MTINRRNRIENPSVVGRPLEGEPESPFGLPPWSPSAPSNFPFVPSFPSAGKEAR